MKRLAVVMAVALLLAGCESQEEARQRNEDRLPTGCRIIDMDYGELRAAVVCEGRKSTTSLREWTETVMVYQPDGRGGGMMVPQTVVHSSLSAQIGEPNGS